MRALSAKHTVAWTVAGLVAGTVGALAVPALANTSPEHRAAVVQTLIVDFSGAGFPGSADVFGSTGQISDTDGNKIGTAHQICAKDLADTAGATAFCHGTLDITSGTANGEIAYSAVLPIVADATGPVDGAFPGVVEGGTGSFDGLTGTTFFTPRAPQGSFLLTVS
ncbi:hypothetical protein ACIQ9P_12460 [Kitasatospora sp. NPDC094019]|uniref:hypothetical protein n=1 Tax=Kitasatospora sp. NPDC094019 TaxID=3364091 RepID=UPI00380D286F